MRPFACTANASSTKLSQAVSTPPRHCPEPVCNAICWLLPVPGAPWLLLPIFERHVDAAWLAVPPGACWFFNLQCVSPYCRALHLQAPSLSLPYAPRCPSPAFIPPFAARCSLLTTQLVSTLFDRRLPLRRLPIPPFTLLFIATRFEHRLTKSIQIHNTQKKLPLPDQQNTLNIRLHYLEPTAAFSCDKCITSTTTYSAHGYTARVHASPTHLLNSSGFLF